MKDVFVRFVRFGYKIMKETPGNPDMKREAFAFKGEITFLPKKLRNCKTRNFHDCQSWFEHNGKIEFSVRSTNSKHAFEYCFWFPRLSWHVYKTVDSKDGVSFARFSLLELQIE